MCHIKKIILFTKVHRILLVKIPTGIHHVNRFFNWLQFLFGFQLQQVEQETNKLRCRIQELGARLDQWLLTRSGGFASGSLLTSHWTRALANNTVLLFDLCWIPLLRHPSRLAIWTTLPRCIMADCRCCYTIHISAYNDNHRSPSTFHVALFH